MGDDRFKTKQLIEEMREWIMSFFKTVARNLDNQRFSQSKVNLIQCEKINIYHTKHGNCSVWLCECSPCEAKGPKKESLSTLLDIVE